MSFIAKDFIFNGTPSEFFNLHLGDVGSSGGGGGEASTDAGSNVSPLTEKLFRRPRLFLYGTEQVAPLSIPLSMYVEREGLDAQSYSEVSAWLFGQNNYGVLRLCQKDMIEIGRASCRERV